MTTSAPVNLQIQQKNVRDDGESMSILCSAVGSGLITNNIPIQNPSAEELADYKKGAIISVTVALVTPAPATPAA